MADAPIKFGALCWNQYTDWPSLLEAGRFADRLGYDSLWTWDHVYPIVGTDRGPMYRGLADDHCMGAGHDPRDGRADGGREHVPRADARREDGDDARPHQPRPGGARGRRRMVRDRASRIRLPVRLRRARAAALARRGAAGDARHAPRRGAVRDRAALHGAAGSQRSPAAPAPGCRSSSAAAARR